MKKLQPENLDLQQITSEFKRRAQYGLSLEKFCEWIDPSFKALSPHKHIIQHLEKVASGEIRRLCIEVPPASGKSMLTSRLFPAWVFGRNPNLRVIEASYNADLASRFGREVRNLLMEPSYQKVFTKTRVARDSAAQDEWSTEKGGTYKAEGVGGGLIGYHAHIAIIDDPIKNWEEGMSPGHRELVWNWYTGTLLNRLLNYKDGPGAVIIIMQRWHDDDLIGRLLKEEGDDWVRIKLPSLAQEDDPLGREVGEPLLPDWRSKEELLKIQARNPAQFQALHQQDPVPEEGDIFKQGDFKRFYSVPDNLTYFGASDYAVSEKRGDWTVHLISGVDKFGNLYIVDLWRDRTNSKVWVDQVISFIKKYEPLYWAEEQGQIIGGVGPFLSLKMQEEGQYTIRKQFSSSRNKVLRTRSFAGMVKEGRVYIPASADWVGPYLLELMKFPNTSVDDQVDASSLLGRLLAKMKPDFVSELAEKQQSQEEARNLTFDEMVDRAVQRRKGVRLPRVAPVAAFN